MLVEVVVEVEEIDDETLELLLVGGIDVELIVEVLEDGGGTTDEVKLDEEVIDELLDDKVVEVLELWIESTAAAPPMTMMITIITTTSATVRETPCS